MRIISCLIVTRSSNCLKSICRCICCRFFCCCDNRKDICKVILLSDEVDKKNASSKQLWGRRGRDHMVVGLATTCAMCAYHHYSCVFELRSWRGVLDTTLCEKGLSVTCDKSVFFPPCTQVSSTSKTDRHDKTEILLKVALNTTNPPLSKLQCKILLVSVNIILYYYFIIENSERNMHRNATGFTFPEYSRYRAENVFGRLISTRLMFRQVGIFCCFYSLTTYFTFLTVT